MTRPLSSGFSLIEVIVTIFIVGVMLLFLQAIANYSPLVRTVKYEGIALTIARNKLEVVRAAGYANIPSSHTFSDSLLSAFPYGATTTLATSTVSAKTQQISVSVIWKDPGLGASTTVSLSTLITQVGGLP